MVRTILANFKAKPVGVGLGLLTTGIRGQAQGQVPRGGRGLRQGQGDTFVDCVAGQEGGL